MTEPPHHRTIAAIHAAPPLLVYEFTGAGSLALHWLHSVAGSSRTVLEASDRYAEAALADLLGGPPAHAVAEPTASAMALAAYQRARQLAAAETACLGLACTATIATDRAKRGEHRCWVASYDGTTLASYGLVLTKGARDRAGEERLVAELVLHAIVQGMGLREEVALALLPSEQVTQRSTAMPDPLAQLLAGQAESVIVTPDGQRRADTLVKGGLLSGSFNPLHLGHERLAAAAAQELGQPVGFELPVRNADKPPLSYREVERRLAQFRWRHTVVLSRAPLFRDKATLFPGCTFVIGYDTAARLIEPRYYGGPAERDVALTHIQVQGCRFLVAGRSEAGVFRTLRDLALPTSFAGLFMELPEERFRVDLSSSAIRAAQARQ